jgi:glycosyltransferase involved in cell wall biosynthesis
MNIDQLEPGAAPGLNVLVVAYYFPPMGLSGVQRTLKFVKYLTEFGWRPIVLTAGETPYYAHDPSLLEELQPLIDNGYVRIVRTEGSGIPGFNFKRKGQRANKEAGRGYGVSGIENADSAKVSSLDTRYPKPDTPVLATLKLPSAGYQRLRSKIIQMVYQPDSRIRWKNSALAAADTIFKEERIDAIFTTAPPYTDFLIARELRDKYNVPYLMDYRDAWVSNPVLNFYITPFHKAYARKLEDECLRGSSAITVVNRRMKEVLLEHYNFLSHEDIMIVPHGYDPADIARAVEIADGYRNPAKFRMTYGGTFYVGRSPQVLFEAIRLAVRKEPELANDLELVFAGILQKEFHRMAQKTGLASNIVSKGYLPHIESIALLLASDVLWMTMSDDISAPGKLYEYLGTGRTILGLVPQGSQAEKILHDYGAGVAVPPKNIKAISEAILDLYRQWRTSSLPRNVNVPFVKTFDRRLLAKEMARQLGLMLV